MRFPIVCVCMLLHALSTHAQFEEYFNYQDLKDATRWRGTDSAWIIQNGQLKSSFGQINSNFYISTIASPPFNNIWQWSMQLNFNTSSLNYVDVYLGANKNNLLDSLLCGYFVRTGNTKDEVCLYRKDPHATPRLLIDGRDGITDHTTNILSVKVTCNDHFKWTLQVNDVVEGTATDSTYASGSIMGFVVRQSTASFAGKHFFDNVIVGNAHTDTEMIRVVINEILYDGAVEFIELYNNGISTVSLSQLFFLRRKSNGGLTDPIAFPSGSLEPGAYAAFTSDPDALLQQYKCMHVYKMALPAFTNESGEVFITGKNGDTIDALHYSDAMHFPLAQNTKGVSLERLNADAPSQQISNWHSASSTVGFATPGIANSQQLGIVDLPGKLTLSSEVFSPDNDGMEDVAVINYALPAPGYVADISIYNAAGRLVKTICNHFLLPPKGFFTWDGTDEVHNIAPTGIYIVFASLIHSEGDVQRWKLPLVLAKQKNT
ncbi:lamin tail domain-containing protein [Chitinophaga sancti]|uniref:Lamin Tail Domain n=1 Tax=Chitinophaga sancti TaxID=1004 RepID=A0A1K1NWS4_9BACT|nr:lamin tail domain-containing protein [Chitinophaga sancti]WQD60273.1 lamin tail domain-containing protein [Chitinophaga sancti]WQG87599.1 lamin tail domain-containing protein [Chitinophaga sancti]SFW39970.1 Lamin Tail Domain [Chitinophaga sancti]